MNAKRMLVLHCCLVSGIACGIAQSGPALADTPTEYRISFPNSVHHEAQIEATFSALGNLPLHLRMSRASPGRYSLHEFGKNVYAVTASDSGGRELKISRPDAYQWDIAGHDGSVTVRYTLFADGAGGTYSAIDSTHAHLNIPATLMWAIGLDDRKAFVTLDTSGTDWSIATQLFNTDAQNRFWAPNLQYLMDSPIESSRHSERNWIETSRGNSYEFSLVVHHLGTEEDVDALLGMVRKVVSEQALVFGELPAFDDHRYTFIADYLPYVVDDAMEHRNSTFLSNTQSLYEADFRQLRSISHEFFHAWNMERLRPRSLEPFDFEKANTSDVLWFAEGFTSYYTELVLARAGELTLEEFSEELARVINVVRSSPGRSIHSAVEMSIRAPLWDDAVSMDPTNFENTFVSYYTLGDAIALGLDLTLRSRYPDTDLDSYMRLLWKTFGEPENPYNIDDLRDSLAAISGDADFANEFFAKYIYGLELPDYESLLQFAGLKLQQKDPDTASLANIELEFDGYGATVSENTTTGSPLYQAGIGRGDRITSVGRFEISDEKSWTKMLARHKPGDTVPIAFEQRSASKSASVTFASDPTLEVVPLECNGMPLTRAQESFRKQWLKLGRDDCSDS
jgi:predicted metalloprotease with PDZ domain